MKKSIKFLALLIQNKLRVDLKVTFDERTEFISTNNEGMVSVRAYPWILLNIIRPYDPNEPRAWNPNDGLGLSTYTLPIFLENLTAIQNDMKTPSLYKYTDNRLELNETAAEKIRKVFMIGNVTVELSAVVIEQNDQRIEGIKMKFNNESSTVALSLNDLESLRYNLNKINAVDFCTQMYLHFYKKECNITPSNLGVINPAMVDIAPLAK